MKFIPHCFVTDVPATGTAVRLSDTSIKCVMFQLEALATDDKIYVGDQEVSTTVYGARLEGADDTDAFPRTVLRVGPYWTDQGFVRFDLRDVWVDCGTNGDDVCCLYWVTEDDEHRT